MRRAWVPCGEAARFANHPVRQLCGNGPRRNLGKPQRLSSVLSFHRRDFPGPGMLTHSLEEAQVYGSSQHLPIFRGATEQIVGIASIFPKSFSGREASALLMSTF